MENYLDDIHAVLFWIPFFWGIKLRKNLFAVMAATLKDGGGMQKPLFQCITSDKPKAAQNKRSDVWISGNILFIFMEGYPYPVPGP